MTVARVGEHHGDFKGFGRHLTHGKDIVGTPTDPSKITTVRLMQFAFFTNCVRLE